MHKDYRAAIIMTVEPSFFLNPRGGIRPGPGSGIPPSPPSGPGLPLSKGFTEGSRTSLESEGRCQGYPSHPPTLLCLRWERGSPCGRRLCENDVLGLN